MRTAVRLRTLTAEEVVEVRRLANSRKEAARLVQRARLITFMLDDPNLYAGDAGLKAGFRTKGSGAMWVRRPDLLGTARRAAGDVGNLRQTALPPHSWMID